jgi:hypothetical protein
MSSYVYRELQHNRNIRLLELSPGAAADPLRGSLRHTSLDEKEDYEAISYVWGSDLRCRVLETPEGVVRITASLHLALERLRFPHHPRALWADALCINQEDNTEKSFQVRLMYQIYSQATRVLAYLGEEAENSELVPPLLDDMTSKTLFDRGTASSLAREKLKSKDLQPVAALLRRPWFRRAWIIQEFVAARDVLMICGSWEVHWKALVEANDNCYSFGELSLSRNEKDKTKTSLTSKSSIALSTLDMARDKNSLEEDHSRYYSSLLDLFELFQDKEATRSRDHLFALLSLASDADDSVFDPDYVEPFESVVRRYAAGFIRQNYCFRLLASAGLNSQSSRFPSWIPDWTIKRKSRFPEGLVDNSATYKAAASTEIVARFDRDADELFIRGGLFDQVVQVLCFWNGGVEKVDDIPLLDGQLQASYLQQCDDIMHFRSCYPTGEGLFDVQWRTLIANRDCDGQELKSSNPPTMKLSYLAFRKELANKTQDDILRSKYPHEQLSVEGNENQEQALTPVDSYDFESAFFSLTRLFTFCLTERGYVGLVPKETKIRDCICVFNGCPVPFVIRQSEIREGNVFQLIGRSYVHGIMDGEALFEERFKEEDLRLH